MFSLPAWHCCVSFSMFSRQRASCARVSFGFLLYRSGWIALTHGTYVCVQLTSIIRLLSCPSMSFVVICPLPVSVVCLPCFLFLSLCLSRAVGLCIRPCSCLLSLLSAARLLLPSLFMVVCPGVDRKTLRCGFAWRVAGCLFLVSLSLSLSVFCFYGNELACCP